MAERSKQCRYCGETKPSDAFNWANRAAGKRQERCRACFSEYNRQRYVEKGKHIRSVVAKYRAENHAVVKQRMHAAYWRDIEASRAKGRANAAIQNPKRKEAKQAWARADRAANPEKWREKDRREYARDPLARKAINLKRRAVKKQMPRGTVNALGLQARWEFYGGRCWMCGGEAVEFDHVKPLKHGGAHMLGNLRPACVPCNRRKQARWPFQAAA